jgi:hypothetical protein
MRESFSPDGLYPPDHQPGMRVPKGGSMCKNCEYLKDAEKKICGEENFVRWNGSPVIPGEIDSYCSDWYRASGKEAAKSRAAKITRQEAAGMDFRELLDDDREVARR